MFPVIIRCEPLFQWRKGVYKPVEVVGEDEVAKILVTARSMDYSASAGLDRHARDFTIFYNSLPELLRLMRREIHHYPPPYEPHIYRSSNNFDHEEVIWIDMLRILSLSIVARLAVRLSQLSELYNAWNMGKDHGSQSILRFAEIALLHCH